MAYRRLRLAVAALFIIAIVHQVATFNLDTVNYMNYDGNPDSMFGFSLALHQESKMSYVVVGAPRADTSRFQKDVQRGGAVYKCDIRENNQCIMVPFDRNGNYFNDRGEQVDTKSNQWFGATVASGGIDGPVVACAPRYVYHTLQPRRVERVDPVGTCYVAKNNFREFTEYSPCRTNFWGYHRQGSCQAGFSAAISKDGDRMLIGAPGSWYWQGQTFSINTASHFPFKPPRYGQFGEGGQVYSSSLITKPEERVYQTQEGTASEDDSYMGYSSASGNIVKGKPGVAVGMPRGGKLDGKVLIYTWNLTNIQNITGEQIGAYFGYALCVVDVDGDKLDDLIIGAPMYTEPNNEGKYEMGRVYIMYQSSSDGFNAFDTRDGISSRGRFGLALTSLGDINLDGYGDFAVGAPYDGPKGRGAVYIYHGMKGGLMEKHSQVIYAEDVSTNIPISTFGFSLSGGIDLDGNLYPDLAVGAYESNTALVFKSRPVAVVEASSIFESENKLISLENLECTLPRSQKKVACTTVTSCLKYTGVNLPQTIDLEISWVLDAKKTRQPRLFFINDEAHNIRNSSIRLTRGKLECRSEKVFIAENIRDKLTPLEVEMKYDMRGQLPASATHVRRPRSILEPVLDHNVGLVQRDSINIQKNCGPDNICIPDLRLDVKAVDKYLLGSKELLIVEVIVTNHGEDAFESNFYMTNPAGLDYKRVDKLGDTQITCTAPNRENNNVLKCELGNPFPGGKVAKFNVILNPSQKSGMAPTFNFYMEANSTNIEREGSGFDNTYKKSIGIWVETDLNIKGNSYPQEFHYNISQYKALENSTTEHDIGPQVVHIYDISNMGPSTIEEVEIYVIWPYETLEGDDLMYLLARPETSGNIQCENSELINRGNYKIDLALEKKGVLEEFTGVTSKLNAQGYAKKQEGGQVSKVAIEKTASGGASTSGGVISGGRIHHQSEKRLTEEEKRKLDAEEDQESTGDASLVHRSRQQGQHGGVSGQYQQQASSSWSSSQGQGGAPVTITKTHNRTTYTGADGRSRTVESSTEYANVQRSSFGSASGNYRQEAHGASVNRPGTYKIPDIHTEEVINHDLSSSASRGSAGGRIANVNVVETTTKATGRRRMMSQGDGESVRIGYSAPASAMDKLAQGGNGFQASTLDIGVMGRTNADEDLHTRGGSSVISSGYGGATSSVSGGGGQRTTFQSGGSSGSYTGGSSGSYTGGTTGKFQYGSNPSASVQHHYSSGSSGGSHVPSIGGPSGTSQLSYTDNDNDVEDDYSLDYDYDTHDNTNVGGSHQGSSSAHHQSSQQHSSNSGGHQQFSGHDGKFQHYRRFRRDLQFSPELIQELNACNATKCAVLKCIAGPMANNERAFIGLRTRLIAYTLDKNTLSVPLNISSKVVARIVKLPYIGLPQEEILKTFEVPVKAIPEPIITPDVVPLWVVILSAVAGILILLLLIYLLYKCGFFKRNRPKDHSQERQPLNRNGNYHGDEHL